MVGGGCKETAAVAFFTFLRCCQHGMLNNYLSEKICISHMLRDNQRPVKKKIYIYILVAVLICRIDISVLFFKLF